MSPDKEAKKRLKKEDRFSMSKLPTIGAEYSGAKFEIEGLEELKPASAPDEVVPEVAEEQQDLRWFDTANLMDNAPKWDQLKLCQQRALGSFVNLSQNDQSAIEDVLDTCTAKGAQQFLLKNWTKLFGERTEISIGDLAEAIRKPDASNKHRAYLIWAMCNYDIIREKSEIGTFWESDITKSDVESMV